MKVECKSCQKLILKSTYKRFEGNCRRCFDRKPEFEGIKKIIVSIATSLNWVLLSGIIVSFTIIYLKIFQKENLKWEFMEIPVNDSWVVFLILTVLHYFLSKQLIKYIDLLNDSGFDQIKKNAYIEIVSSNNIFLRGMIPRLYPIEKKFWVFYKPYLKDLTYWLAIITFFSIIAANIKYDFTNIWILIFSIIGGLIIAYFNWVIGSMWLVRVSNFAEYSDVFIEISGYHNFTKRRLKSLKTPANSK